MKKKLVSMLLIAAMAGTMVGQGVMVHAAENEPVELSVLSHTSWLTKDVEEMQWLAEVEEEANVSVTYEQIRTGWDDVKQTRFASGEIPDILMFAVTSEDLALYDGLFLDLTDYITPELTPNIYAMFEEEPAMKVLSTQADGRIYSLPKFRADFPSTIRAMFINKVWLDNLGLEVPTTFSELKEVLIAFRDQDANGNGDPNDEIPLSPLGIVGDQGLTWFLGSLGIQIAEQNNMYCAEDGVVQCYRVDERFKLLMKFCADLWKENLIDQNIFSNDYSLWQATSRGNEAGDATVGISFKWDPTDGFGVELYDQYVAFAPMEYDIDCEPGTYDVRIGNDFNACNLGANLFAISAECKDPEAALRFIDTIYSPTHSVEALYGGISDGCIEKIDENKYKVLPPADSTIDAGTWKWTNSFVNNAGVYIRRNMEIEHPQDEILAIEAREPYLDILSKSTPRDLYVELFQKFTVDEMEEMAFIETELKDIFDSYASKWLIGELDIDATWDEYVQKANDAGLEDALKIRQNAFDVYLTSIGQ